MMGAPGHYSFAWDWGWASLQGSFWMSRPLPFLHIMANRYELRQDLGRGKYGYVVMVAPWPFTVALFFKGRKRRARRQGDA